MPWYLRWWFAITQWLIEISFNKKGDKNMGAVGPILAIALPFAKDLIAWWMETSGKTSITLADLKAKSPDELLAEVGVVLP